MTPDDKDRSLSGVKPEGEVGRKERLEIQAENLKDDLSYEPGMTARTVNIEQELEKALADDNEPVTAEDLNFSFPKAKKPVTMGKLIVPTVLLVACAGVAGYIALHPEILARKTSAAPISVAMNAPADASKIVLAQASPAEAQQAATVPVPDTPRPNDTAAAAAAASSPVQPAPSAVPTSPSMSAPLLAQATSNTPLPANASAPAPASSSAPAKPADLTAKSGSGNIPAAPPALSAPDSNPDNLADIASDMKKAPDSEPVPVPDGQAPHPDQGKLQATGAPASSATAANTSPVKNKMPKNAVKDSDAYYDADATTPSGKGVTAGPRKVDPNKEPGQKLVIVSGVRKSTDTESMVVAADRALKLGRYDAALDMYNNLYVKNSHDPRILMGRAVAQENLGMTDSAIQSYNDLLDISPNNADAMVNMLGLLKKKDPAGAMQRMVQLEDKFPNHPGLAAQIGIAEGESGNYQEAMRYLGKAATLEPNNPQDPFNMAVLADRQGDTANAIKFYEQALTVDSENAGGVQTIPRESVYDRLAVLRRRS